MKTNRSKLKNLLLGLGIAAGLCATAALNMIVYPVGLVTSGLAFPFGLGISTTMCAAFSYIHTYAQKKEEKKYFSDRLKNEDNMIQIKPTKSIFQRTKEGEALTTIIKNGLNKLKYLVPFWNINKSKKELQYVKSHYDFIKEKGIREGTIIPNPWILGQKVDFIENEYRNEQRKNTELNEQLESMQNQMIENTSLKEQAPDRESKEHNELKNYDNVKNATPAFVEPKKFRKTSARVERHRQNELRAAKNEQREKYILQLGEERNKMLDELKRLKAELYSIKAQELTEKVKQSRENGKVIKTIVVPTKLKVRSK